MSGPCPFCGQQRAHYLTHICADCECHHVEVRIPGEPHIPSYYESEMNPDCPVHGDRKRAWPSPSRHEVTLKKKARFGGLDPLYQPICADCGPLDDALDLDDARAKKSRHAGAVAAVTGADHGGAS